MSTLPPGIHAMPADAYHADEISHEQPSLSASVAKTLLARSPLHAWHDHPRLNPNREPIESSRLDNGTAAHTLLFGDGRKPHIVHADSWRTNAAKTQRDEARKAGLVPLLEKEAAAVTALTDAIAKQLDKLNCNPRPFTEGKPERTLVWRDRGVLCRARCDWLRDDFTIIEDLKSTGTSADPHEWSRTRLWNDGLDVQAGMYRRGVKAITGVTPDWRFVVVENKPPYALSVISLSPEALELADRKVAKALDLWKGCLDSGDWPGYPPQVCYAELPPWEEARWLERQVLVDWDATGAAA